MKSSKFLRHVIDINNRDLLKEITVVVLGNANSGKSSMVGVLTDPALRNFSINDFLEKKEIPENVLDDGNGRSRKSILRFIHEKETGRTSSISYNPMLLNNNGVEKIINFVDLAGHEAYLKTTIRGVTSSFPDYGLVCIEKSITKMTLEHINLLCILQIPFSIIMSKIDSIPRDKIKENIVKIIKYVKNKNKKTIIIKDVNDIKFIHENYIPIILLSNKTGIGYDKLSSVLDKINEKEGKKIPKVFMVDKIYNVQGFGLVVCGMSGITIFKNDELLLGPFTHFGTSEFIKVKVRSIHDDYKNFIDELKAGVKGCLCIRFDDRFKQKVVPGMVLINSMEDINYVKKFKAKIHVLDGTTCTITPGYNAVLNTGGIKTSVRFVSLSHLDYHNEQESKKEFTRGGEINIAEIEFLKTPCYISMGDTFIFREGSTIGYGTVLDSDSRI